VSFGPANIFIAQSRSVNHEQYARECGAMGKAEAASGRRHPARRTANSRKSVSAILQSGVIPVAVEEVSIFKK
jgi:hypothetical protein